MMMAMAHYPYDHPHHPPPPPQYIYEHVTLFNQSLSLSLYLCYDDVMIIINDDNQQ
jgi:hypothetical protein